MIIIALLAALGQAASVQAAPPPALPPPAFFRPPSPPPPRSDQITQFAETLRRACMSERGVEVVVSQWSSRHQPEAIAARLRITRDIEDEIGRVALTAPIDVERLERAHRAHDQDQARHRQESTDESMAILKALSPADRVIYARRMTIMQSAWPEKTCPMAPQGAGWTTPLTR